MTESWRREMRAAFAVLGLALLAAIAPMPGGRAKEVLRSLRSPSSNRGDREKGAVGYYVGLIDGGPGSGRDELTLRLMGKTSEWKTFHDVDATEYLDGDLLQFELKPNQDKAALGSRFTTNARGLRDREYPAAKPPGTIRVALLGSSMDMGWGVRTEETYENLLEAWLNAHAAKFGIARRFEVINYAMAAYSPLHRLETFRRKAIPDQPDLVLYSATMLDARLMEIHLRNLLLEGIDPRYSFLREALAGLGDAPRDKDALKAMLRPRIDAIAEATLADLSERCRAKGLPLAMLIVPRVGQADAPAERREAVGRLSSTARSLGLPLLDLSATFDDRDPARIEIAAWDDHPNALGHKLLFEALARRLVEDESLYRTVFGAEPPGERTAP